ncbi:MAG: hypothetical protein AB7F88_03115 [Pyrinomonadaceae bacterium]
MIDAKHIAALEAWLNKTRDEQNQLIARLRETEEEIEKLRGQIGALDDIAQQAESMIDNALVLMRDGIRGTSKKTPTSITIDDSVPVSAAVGRRAAESQPTYTAPVHRTGGSGTIAYLDRSRPATIRQNRIEPISNRFADRTITQACTLLLREAGVPLHVNELYNLLVAGGMEFKGNNPTISVAVSLNRNRRFRKVGPGTFDLMMREASQQQAAS